MFVYKLIDNGINSRYSYLNFSYFSSKELLNQETTECRFTLKRLCGTTRTQIEIFLAAPHCFIKLFHGTIPVMPSKNWVRVISTICSEKSFLILSFKLSNTDPQEKSCLSN